MTSTRKLKQEPVEPADLYRGAGGVLLTQIYKDVLRLSDSRLINEPAIAVALVRGRAARWIPFLIERHQRAVHVIRLLLKESNKKGIIENVLLFLLIV